MAEKRDIKRTFSTIQKNAIWDRQNGKCWYCGKPLQATIAEFHHLKPHSRKGKTVSGNGVALHPDCHRTIHKQESLKKADTKRPKTTTNAKPKAREKSTKKRSTRRNSPDPFGVGEIKVPRLRVPGIRIPKW
jgi:5-methylcytosine-specific restriction endonuclease McrA